MGLSETFKQSSWIGQCFEGFCFVIHFALFLCIFIFVFSFNIFSVLNLPHFLWLFICFESAKCEDKKCKSANLISWKLIIAEYWIDNLNSQVTRRPHSLKLPVHYVLFTLTLQHWNVKGSYGWHTVLSTTHSQLTSV